MKLSDAIAKYLVDRGIKVVFGYQGGSITHLIDSFDKYGIEYIQNYNEQGSALAADAYSRIKNNSIGVAIGTNGPGATNMITGIANAFCDSIPVLFFTGQVHTFAMKKDDAIRQESFQELEILPIVKPITKYCTTILDKENAIAEIDKAIKIAKEGRPGPVLIDLPVDIQGEDVEYYEPVCNKLNVSEYQKVDLSDIFAHIRDSKKPIILAGGGIRLSNSVEIFKSIINKLGIPVVTSLMGLDVLPHSDENYYGFIGTYGNRYANLAIQEADLLLVLGSRLDMRQTGKRRDLFAPNAKIIHIDIDEYELNHFVKENISLNVDIYDFLSEMEKLLDNSISINIQVWKSYLKELKILYCDCNEIGNKMHLNPNIVFKLLGDIIPEDSIVCSDVGQNQMWLAQSLRLKGENFRILNSGGLGTMGYSLPASIGAHYADKDAFIFAFMGDGGLQMNIQELQVIGSRNLPIVILVLNNHALGLIRDVHEKYYNKRYVGSVIGFSQPSLKKLSDAYGLGYFKLNNLDDVMKIKDLFNGKKPLLVEIDFQEDTYVHPELLGNDGLDRQIPYKE